MESKVLSGKVVYYNSIRGYGFVQSDDTGTEYFYHISDCTFMPVKDNFVSFELTKYGDKVKAVKVAKVDNN